MRKEQTLAHWKALPPAQNPLQYMTPIPYKAKGSRYGACGVRIDGSPEFVDAVLSCLKALIDGENCITRLELARSKVDGSTLGKAFENATNNAEVCYIRLHQRGSEGAHMAAYDKSLHAATFKTAELWGHKV